MSGVGRTGFFFVFVFIPQKAASRPNKSVTGTQLKALRRNKTSVWAAAKRQIKQQVQTEPRRNAISFNRVAALTALSVEKPLL